jgi:pilus assembly protein CpaF
MLRNVIDEIAALVPEVAKLLAQPDVTEVLVNPDGSVFTERGGRLLREGFEISSQDLEPAITRIVYPLGKDFSEARPLVEARLADGSRIAAARPPAVAKDGIALSIRRFPKRYSLPDLIEMQALTPEQAHTMLAAVRNRKNILISGGTGSGKTTLLNALLEHIDRFERLIIIEDVAEIYVEGRENVVQLEAQEDVSVRDCLRHALRQRPDRIIVGEVRGASAYDLLEAWNTGHSGSIATIHADRAARASGRLRNLAMQTSEKDLDRAVIQDMIDDSLDMIVHVLRDDSGRRRVVEIRQRSHDVYGRPKWVAETPAP